MRINKLKEKILHHELALGVTMQEESLQSIEIFGILGFDYINIDCLHSALTIDQVSRMIITAELRGLSVIVRVPLNMHDTIGSYLDIGASGIIVADINNADSAYCLVDAVKFEPEGSRSLASVHAADYGLLNSLSEFAKFSNRETMAIGIVESKAGLDAIDDILAVPGLDGIIIGTTDLAKSLGVTGQARNPLVGAAISHVLEAGKKSGKAIGITLRNNESLDSMAAQGFSFIGIHMKSLLTKACKDHLGQFALN